MGDKYEQYLASRDEKIESAEDSPSWFSSSLQYLQSITSPIRSPAPAKPAAYTDAAALANPLLTEIPADPMSSNTNGSQVGNHSPSKKTKKLNRNYTEPLPNMISSAGSPSSWGKPQRKTLASAFSHEDTVTDGYVSMSDQTDQKTSSFGPNGQGIASSSSISSSSTFGSIKLPTIITNFDFDSFKKIFSNPAPSATDGYKLSSGDAVPKPNSLGLQPPRPDVTVEESKKSSSEEIPSVKRNSFSGTKYTCNLPTCMVIAGRFRCPICYQKRLPKDTSVFCCQEHFEQHWSEHKKLHDVEQEANSPT